jgi:hypothetical protein
MNNKRKMKKKKWMDNGAKDFKPKRKEVLLLYLN